MPELPEVQTVVNTLVPFLVGKRFGHVVHVRDDIVSPNGFNLRDALKQRRVVSITRRAKRIIVTLSDGNAFYVHLGMSGRLTIERGDAIVETHTHLIVNINDGKMELRFRDPRRFGGIFWLGKKRGYEDDLLGPEPLTLRPAQLVERLSRTKRNIKNALLDQKLIAGLGNIYVDESLFTAGIRPTRIASELSAAEVRSLTFAIKRTLRKALKHRGSTLRDYVDAEGGQGAFQNLHTVYGREKLPCSKCKAPIRRIVIGGRSTHFCVRCQK